MPAEPRPRILIVDDSRAIHDDFRKILSVAAPATEADESEAALFDAPIKSSVRKAFTVDSAFQGEEALRQVQQSLKEGRPYALAFVDIRMPPGWDGIETIIQVWKVDPDLQVVICSAYSDYSWDDMIDAVGQSDRLVILKKPFDVVEVLQLANALVAKWELLQAVRSQVADLEEQIRRQTADMRFLRDSFSTLLPVLQIYARLRAAVSGGPGPIAAILEEVDLVVQKAELDYLIAELVNAGSVAEAHDGTKGKGERA